MLNVPKKRKLNWAVHYIKKSAIKYFWDTLILAKNISPETLVKFDRIECIFISLDVCGH